MKTTFIDLSPSDSFALNAAMAEGNRVVADAEAALNMAKQARTSLLVQAYEAVCKTHKVPGPTSSPTIGCDLVRATEGGPYTQLKYIVNDDEPSAPSETTNKTEVGKEKLEASVLELLGSRNRKNGAGKN
jgi:hypothetical protein